MPVTPDPDKLASYPRLQAFYAKVNDPQLDGLSFRVRKAFANGFISLDSAITRKQVSLIPNFGKRSTRELVDWLDSKNIQHQINAPIRPRKIKCCPHCGGAL